VLLVHNPQYMRTVRDDDFKLSVQELQSLSNLSGVELVGNLNMLDPQTIKQFTLLISFYRLKLLNLILTFFLIILENTESKSHIVVEFSGMQDSPNALTSDLSSTVFLNQLINIIETLLLHFSLLDLHHMASVLAETLSLILRLGHFGVLSVPNKKLAFGLLSKVIDSERKEKIALRIPISYFGDTQSVTHENYLRYVFLALENLYLSEKSAEYSSAILMEKLFSYYDLERENISIFDEQMYLSFMGILSRIEIQHLKLTLINSFFKIFDQNKTKYVDQLISLYQFIFLKRLIIFSYEENDIFQLPSVVTFYNKIFEKFEDFIETINKVASLKLAQKPEEPNTPEIKFKGKNVPKKSSNIVVHKNLRKFDGLIMKKNKTAEPGMQQGAASEIETKLEQDIDYLKSIAVLAYECIILSFKFTKFTEKIDSVDTVVTSEESDREADLVQPILEQIGR
jgi:hypothetical protein